MDLLEKYNYTHDLYVKNRRKASTLLCSNKKMAKELLELRRMAIHLEDALYSYRTKSLVKLNEQMLMDNQILKEINLSLTNTINKLTGIPSITK